MEKLLPKTLRALEPVAVKNVIYSYPIQWLRKSHVRVKFQSLPGTTAGAVYEVRILRK
jgi:hypothetical protein